MSDALPFAVLVAGLAGAVALRGPLGEQNAERRRHDFRYTPDPRFVRLAAGAHRSTTADVMWLRTLPDLAKEFSDPKLKARWIDHSLDAITDLEPSFMRVYEFGESYLSILERSSPGAADRAIALVEKGIRTNPESPDLAGLTVRLAMIHYIEKRDRAKTLELLAKASTMDNFDSLSAGMLSRMRADERDDLVAIRYWAERIENGSPEIRRVAELHLYRTKAEIVRRAARDFAAESGRRPRTADEFVHGRFVQPEVVGVLLDGLVVDENGAIRYPRADELEREHMVLTVERWARSVHDESGAWPKLEDIERLPAPPAGRRWRFEEGRLTAEDSP